MTQIFLGHKKNFGPKIFFTLKLFWTHNFFWTQNRGFQTWQGQRFYFNWSLTLKTKSELLRNSSICSIQGPSYKHHTCEFCILGLQSNMQVFGSTCSSHGLNQYNHDMLARQISPTHLPTHTDGLTNQSSKFGQALTSNIRDKLGLSWPKLSSSWNCTTL